MSTTNYFTMSCEHNIRYITGTGFVTDKTSPCQTDRHHRIGDGGRLSDSERIWATSSSAGGAGGNCSKDSDPDSFDLVDAFVADLVFDGRCSKCSPAAVAARTTNNEQRILILGSIPVSMDRP